MSHVAEITTPIPSAEQVAGRLGLSKRKKQMLFALADRQGSAGKPANTARLETSRGRKSASSESGSAKSAKAAR